MIKHSLVRNVKEMQNCIGLLIYIMETESIVDWEMEILHVNF